MNIPEKYTVSQSGSNGTPESQAMKVTPSYVQITADMLPPIKDWKVGARYYLRLEVLNQGARLGSIEDSSKMDYVGTFKVLNAQAVDVQDVQAEQKAVAANAIQSAFDRAAEQNKGG